MSLPPLRRLAGTAPTFLEPPFRSEHLSLRYLPLRANAQRLSEFIDAYINLDGQVPESVGRFRPYSGFVTLVIADHPRLISEGSNTWVSQHEIAFMVPVTWHRRVGKRWEFVGLAWVEPFIYLDDALGLTTGRQVWGWDKALVDFPVWETQWTGTGSAPLMRMEMELPSSMTEPASPAALVEIDRVAPPTNPIAGWAGTINAMARQWQAAMRQLASGHGMADLRRMMSTGIDLSLDAWRSAMRFPPVMESVVPTLQQFREIGRPDEVSYQALVTSTMRFETVHRAGMLGLARMWMGDVSGGLQVSIRDSKSQPIVDMLGLEPDRQEREQGPEGETTISRFSPVMPYEVVVDATYGAGDVQCWRRRTGGWMKPLASPSAEPVPIEDADASADDPNLYDIALGPATQAKAPPFELRRVRVTLLRLPARAAALREVVNEWIGDPGGGASVEVPAGPGDRSFVELTVARTEDDPSRVVVSFRIPVRLETPDREPAESLGFVAPFEYTNRGVASITGEETEGRRITAAVIESLPGSEHGVSVVAEFAANTDAGEESVPHTVAMIEISTDAEAPPIELDALIETIDGPYVGLAQFPDSAFPRYACVQQVAATPFVARDPVLVGLVRGRVTLPRHPAQSIADRLGLIADESGALTANGATFDVDLRSEVGFVVGQPTRGG
jgi:hypothetical protein